MLPLYTDDDYLLPPPYSLADMDVLGVWLNGKSANLQAYLDKHLNVGGGTRYLLLTQVAGALTAGANYPMLLTFHNIGKLTSTAVLNGQSLANRGFFSYKEMILWVPVFAVNAAIPALFDFLNGSIPPVSLVTPLILADNALAEAGGREIFGLPKRLGVVNMPIIPTQQSMTGAGTRLDEVLAGQSASIITDVLQPYNPATRASKQSILDVTFRTHPGGAGGTVIANTWDALLRNIVNEAAGFFSSLAVIPFVAEAVEAALGLVVNAFIDTFLQSIKIAAHKELRRGIVDYRQTSYSSINTMTYSVNFQEGHIINGLDIKVTPNKFANISLEDMFGLRAETVSYAFHARMSGELSGSAENRLNP